MTRLCHFTSYVVDLSGHHLSGSPDGRQLESDNISSVNWALRGVSASPYPHLSRHTVALLVCALLRGS